MMGLSKRELTEFGEFESQFYIAQAFENQFFNVYFVTVNVKK